MEGIPLDHLPRKSQPAGGKEQPANGTPGLTPVDIPTPTRRSDPALQLLEPLLQQGQAGPSTWNSKHVSSVKEQLRNAIHANKIRNHALVSAQFADITAQVRTADHLSREHGRIEELVHGLEAQVDHEDAETSFLPPVLNQLSTHFRHVSRRETARAHLEVTRAVRAEADRLRRIEEAVWSGRSAQADIMADLTAENGTGGRQADAAREARLALLEGTKVYAAMQARTDSLRKIVRAQAEHLYDKLVTLGTAERLSITVRTEGHLPEPQAPRPDKYPRPSPSALPTYILSEIMIALHRLDALQPHLDSISAHVRIVISAIICIPRSHRLDLDEQAEISTLRCAQTGTDGSRDPREILTDVRSIIAFIDTTLLPSSESDHSGLGTLISQTRDDLFRHIIFAMLNNVLIPATPTTLSSIPDWLALLSEAAAIESSLPRYSSTSTDRSASIPLTLIADFMANEAGATYATLRAQAALEQVKALVLGGWGGWDAMEVQKEREEVRVVLVEEEVPAEEDSGAVHGQAPSEGARHPGTAVASTDQDDEAGDGWGFDDVPPLPSTSSPIKGKKHAVQTDDTVNDDAGEGWGFDGDIATPSAAQPSASIPATIPTNAPPSHDVEMDEGWDFDLAATSPPATTSTQATAAVPVPAKPKAREAKKLGKKIGKDKARLAAQEAESGMSGSEDVDMVSSGMSDRSAPDRTGMTAEAALVKADADVQAEGWGWEEDQPSSTDLGTKAGSKPPPAASARSTKQHREVIKPKRTHTVVKEEKVTFRDTYLVSKSCQQLISLVQQCLDEAFALHSAESLPPDFAHSAYNLVTAASSVLTLFRALIFASPHVSDVPTLGMQLSNDCAWMAEHLPTPLSSSEDTEGYSVDASGAGKEAELPIWDRTSAVALMQSAAVHAYESQLATQREGLMRVLEDLPELGDVGDEMQHKAALRVMGEVKGIIDSLGRVWKLVLPRPQYLAALGHLVDITLLHLLTAVLSLLDIPQVESDHLVEILTELKHVETMGIFDAQPASGALSGDVDRGAAVPMPISTIATHVPHWLKYVYLIELLGASLSDIGQLLDHGALVDFEREELVRLVRALFAESEVREGVVARIESL